jgi:hypothetical protein
MAEPVFTRLYRLSAGGPATTDNGSFDCGAQGRAQSLLAGHPAVEPWRIQGFVGRLNGEPLQWRDAHDVLNGGFLIVRTCRRRRRPRG